MEQVRFRYLYESAVKSVMEMIKREAAFLETAFPPYISHMPPLLPRAEKSRHLSPPWINLPRHLPPSRAESGLPPPAYKEEVCPVYVSVEEAIAELQCQNPVETIEAPGGKPFLKDFPGLFFSLSHSGAYAACAVSDREVGQDTISICRNL